MPAGPYSPILNDTDSKSQTRLIPKMMVPPSLENPLKQEVLASYLKQLKTLNFRHFFISPIPEHIAEGMYILYPLANLEQLLEFDREHQCTKKGFPELKEFNMTILRYIVDQAGNIYLAPYGEPTYGIPSFDEMAITTYAKLVKDYNAACNSLMDSGFLYVDENAKICTVQSHYSLKTMACLLITLAVNRLINLPFKISAPNGDNNLTLTLHEADIKYVLQLVSLQTQINFTKIQPQQNLIGMRAWKKPMATSHEVSPTPSASTTPTPIESETSLTSSDDATAYKALPGEKRNRSKFASVALADQASKRYLLLHGGYTTQRRNSIPSIITTQQDASEDQTPMKRAHSSPK